MLFIIWKSGTDTCISSCVVFFMVKKLQNSREMEIFYFNIAKIAYILPTRLFKLFKSTNSTNSVSHFYQFFYES